MKYVGPCYKYNDWMRLVQYTRSMHRYGLSVNYIQLKYKAQNKRAMMYMDGRPKTTGNNAGFINSTQPGSTLKKPKCIFELREGNDVFVCAIKSIATGKELFTD